MELEGDELANEKLKDLPPGASPQTLVPLSGQRITRSRRPAKTRSAASPPSGLKATRPDGKEFTIYFDKTSGLPVKLVAKMVGFDGQE